MNPHKIHLKGILIKLQGSRTGIHVRLVQLGVIPRRQQLHCPAMPGLQLPQWHHADDGDRDPRALKAVHHLPKFSAGPAGHFN